MCGRKWGDEEVQQMLLVPMLSLWPDPAIDVAVGQFLPSTPEVSPSFSAL